MRTNLLAGVPLLDHWDRFVSKDTGPNIFDDDTVRVNLLEELASIVVQFESSRYRKGGTPLFDLDGTFDKIGPLVTRDLGLEIIETLPELIEPGPSSDQGMSTQRLHHILPLAPGSTDCSTTFTTDKRLISLSQE